MINNNEETKPPLSSMIQDVVDYAIENYDASQCQELELRLFRMYSDKDIPGLREELERLQAHARLLRQYSLKLLPPPMPKDTTSATGETPPATGDTASATGDTASATGDTASATVDDPPELDDSLSLLPAELQSNKAVALLRKAQQKGWLDERWMPIRAHLSLANAALLANHISSQLDLRGWKAFVKLWGRRNIRQDFNKAQSQPRSLHFQKELKKVLK